VSRPRWLLYLPHVICNISFHVYFPRLPVICAVLLLSLFVLCRMFILTPFFFWFHFLLSSSYSHIPLFAFFRRETILCYFIYFILKICPYFYLILLFLSHMLFIICMSFLICLLSLLTHSPSSYLYIS
jgi:hypothetical protein